MELLRTAHAPRWRAQAHALRASLPPHALLVLFTSSCPLILPASQCARTHAHTGSKFLRAPPFCGAVLVPGRIMERLILTDVDMPAGLRHFMSCNEVPPALADWRSALKPVDNVGLALRWVAALEEMEPFLEIPVQVRDLAMSAWHDGVVQLIGKYQEQLVHMENIGNTITTIVSVRLRRKKGGYLNVNDSKKVFEWMTQDMTQVMA
jgi:hypothetical protein